MQQVKTPPKPEEGVEGEEEGEEGVAGAAGGSSSSSKKKKKKKKKKTAAAAAGEADAAAAGERRVAVEHTTARLLLLHNSSQNCCGLWAPYSPVNRGQRLRFSSITKLGSHSCCRCLYRINTIRAPHNNSKYVEDVLREKPADRDARLYGRGSKICVKKATSPC